MQHAGSYDIDLVALSVVIAVFASYTALDLASRVPASEGWKRYGWLAAAAFTMGGGIWSMHFVGMLAFTLPGMDVSYNWALTSLSLLLPILVTCFGFFVASGPSRGPRRLVFSGFVMGLGIVAMHYTGMAAMRMSASLHYQFAWVAVSVAIAIGAAIVAIWLAFQRTSPLQRVLASLVMGAAISGMHYSAMQGAIFAYMAPMTGMSVPDVDQLSLALGIAGITAAILCIGLIATVYDRQIRLRAENEAVALRQVFETSHLYQWLLSTEGILQYANKTALAGIKARLDDVVNKAFWDTPWFSDTQGMREKIRSAVAEVAAGNPQSFNLTLDLPVGTRTFDYSVRPVRDHAAKIIAIVPEAVDITVRLSAESQLRQAQKMEVLGSLTGGIAHDFNNLLMAILGSLELLRKRMPQDEQLIRFLDMAVAGAQRGSALTQRLLSFARRQDLRPAAVQLCDLAAGMSDLLDRAIGSDVTLETRFPAALPPVFVDANQLELAVLNLVVNARDAMSEGGTITIGAREAANASEGPAEDGRYICLYVRDSGQGMDKETLAQATDPFFTTKDPGKGTGLGLSMVQGLAEQSGGRLILSSEPGEGTTAEIWLPVAQAVQSSAPAEVL